MKSAEEGKHIFVNK